MHDTLLSVSVSRFSVPPDWPVRPCHIKTLFLHQCDLMRVIFLCVSQTTGCINYMPLFVCLNALCHLMCVCVCVSAYTTMCVYICVKKLPLRHVCIHLCVKKLPSRRRVVHNGSYPLGVE